MLRAKKSISNQIDVYVYSQSKRHIKCTHKECTKSLNSYAIQQSANMLNHISIVDQYIDNKNNIYYIQSCTPKINLDFQFQNNSKPNYPNEVTKKSCIYQSNYPHKTISEQKEVLVQKAKTASVNELYGELIASITKMENGKIKKDTISQKAIGTVRTKGDPIFYQGKNLGEICSNVTSYVTDEDLAKYRPQKVELNRFCYLGKSVNIDDLKINAKYKAYQEIIGKYKPSLKLSGKEAENYIHQFIISNDKFDFDTQSYCFDVQATILPYELEFQKNRPFTDDSMDIKSGLVAIFYDENDFDMKKPLYQTYLPSLDLQYQKLPLNNKIKSDKAYIIKINGYVKSEEVQSPQLKLYENVYSLNLFLNNKKVLTRLNSATKVQLKKGLNKLNLIVKTANAYDFRIVGLNDFYTKPF